MSKNACFLSKKPYLKCMDIYQVGSDSLAAATNSADIYAVAVNSAIPMTVGGKDGLLLYASVLPEGISTSLFTEIAGTSAAVLSVSPQYYPFATDGAECGALVNNLSWANDNLETGYEYIQLVERDASKSQNAVYFVSGVLNSSKTDFNDPFDSAKGVVFAANWAGEYAVGLNPF